MVYRGLEQMGMTAAHDAARELFRPVIESENAREGVRARVERRPPEWRGR